MLTDDKSSGEHGGPKSAKAPGHPSPNLIAAGFLSWITISAGFIGLKMLMAERPEFAGLPASSSKPEMIQESPWVVARKLSDDVSVIKPMQPEHADVLFDMAGRRDYRGLRTVMDMSGEVRARFELTNAFDEGAFVLFKCPHPRTGSQGGASLPASGLKLESSVRGVQENTGDAWLWSGLLEAHGGASIDISYQAASLGGASYHVGEQNGSPVKNLRVTFRRKDLPSMRFESGDGPKNSTDESVTWDRRDFLAPDFFSGVIVESRSLYQSLSQLLEIGPGVCLFFLLAAAAVILARQELNAVQIITIAVGFALYFPLILYLSAHLSFPLALVVAAAVPGALLINYARWLLGARLGLLGGAAFLALYWVFPTLAAFAGWNRGLVLLCLGVVTLYVLIDLQNQALQRKAVVAALFLLLTWPRAAVGSGVQVIVPGELVTKAEHEPENAMAIVAFAPAQYQVRQETNYFHVEAQAAFQVLRAGHPSAPLFGPSVYLLEFRVESVETNLAWIVSATNKLWLEAQHAGNGTLRLSYRVPIDHREGKRRAEIPVLAGMAGNVRIESARNDLEILTGALWTKGGPAEAAVYDIGITGEEKLALEWRESGSPASSNSPPTTTSGLEAQVSPAKPAEPARDFYGIGLTRAQHLTVINSDGSCTHFAEFEMPAVEGEEFRMKLPAQAKLISVSVNGNEIQSPLVESQICRVKMPDRAARQAVNRLSFRIAYPLLKLGFIGTADLVLPEVFQTAGTTEWVVALPNGFETQVISSGLQTQKSPPDLSHFGDYGRILQSHAHIYLAKDLAPPGLVGLSLKYRQMVPGLSASGPP